MSVLIKKLLLALMADKKTWKTAIGILLGMIVMILMPIGAVTALLNSGITIDPEVLKQEVQAQMSGEVHADTQRLEEILSRISVKMTEAGFSEQVKAAQNLAVVFLSDRMGEATFVEQLVSCFQPGQTNESFLAAVNEAFDTEISLEDLSAVAGELAIKTDVESEIEDSGTENSSEITERNEAAGESR